jgi:hypothetical protein
VSASQQGGQLNEAYKTVAQNHDGLYIAGGLFSRPSVRFTHMGTRVLLDIYSTRGEHETYYTQLHFRWPEQKLRFEVFPENAMSTLGKLLGTQDIIIGHDDFDRDYIIRGNDESLIAELLTPAVQAQINQLRGFLGNNDIYVGSKAGTLLVKKLSLIRAVNSLERFVQLGLELYHEVISLGSEGIDFVGAPESAFTLDVAHAICQICGESITENPVLCRACKTPHHQDCWVYYGRCSTYGCGETRYTAARR